MRRSLLAACAMLFLCSLCALCVLCAAGSALAAETPMAGQEAAKEAPAAAASGAATSTSGAAGASDAARPEHDETIEIRGGGPPKPVEDGHVGDYEQPRWSATRRFPTTRVYVMPKGRVEAEYWMRYTAPFAHSGANREIRSFYELGFGLGHRLQADVYLVTQQEGQGPIEVKRQTFELRWAIADWGKLWGNPTLYVEYQNRNGENDYLEAKILLGGEIAPRLHGGLNLVIERELGGNREDEWNLTGGVSYTVVDQVFHVGAEGYVEVHDVKGGRFEFAHTEQLFLAGPSFMVSPVEPFHLLFAPLFGAGKGGGGDKLEGRFRLWFVSAWAF
jgi:hypothetical protein